MANTKRTKTRKTRTTSRKSSTKPRSKARTSSSTNPAPTKKTGVFSKSFNNAISRGVPCSTAIENIAKRNGKTVNFVMNSLCKSGDVYRQKFNGQWVCWPCNVTKKSNASTCKEVQCDMWQNFVDWCICSGQCTPEQLKKQCSSQKSFMKYCKKFFGRQFPAATTTKRRKTTGRKTRTTSAGNYKFPLRRAA